MSDELKPCPFCGGKAGEAMWRGHVGCLNELCGAHHANLPIAAWNTRRDAAQVREECARVADGWGKPGTNARLVGEAIAPAIGEGKGE